MAKTYNKSFSLILTPNVMIFFLKFSKIMIFKLLCWFYQSFRVTKFEQFKFWILINANLKKIGHVDLWTMFTITLSDEEITKIKVIDLDELYIFGIHHFFSWNHLVFQNLFRTCYFLNLKIWIVQTLSNKKNDQINTVT